MSNSTTAEAVSQVRTLSFNVKFLPELEMRLAELNKRAEKIGVEPMRFEEIERKTVQIHVIETGLYVIETRVTGNLVGSTPRIEGGWTLISVIEHLEGGNVLSSDDVRAEQYRQAKADCDHCNTKRYRAKTVIVVNDAGETKQVGLQCMKDFLGYHKSPESLLGYVKKMSELEEFSGYSKPQAETVMEVLVIATLIVRKRGFAPTSSTSTVPTNVIVDWCFGRNLPWSPDSRKEANRILESLGEITDEDVAYATNCSQWVLSLPENSDGYLGNLRAACGGALAEKQGLVVSAVQAYAKHLDQVAKREKQDAQVKGTVVAGNSIEITGTVVSLKYVDGYGYNAPDVLKMTVEVEQADGVVRLWGSVPTSIECDVERGSKVTFIANIETGDSTDFGFFKRPRKAQVVAA